jgi:hypothetical protein
MEPLKIKLTYYEGCEISAYCFQEGIQVASPDISDECIVLAEYFEKIVTKIRWHGFRDRNKVFLYTIPVSVGRILHRRWQQEAYNPKRQMVLKALDYELTKRNLKPYLFKPMIV